MKNFPILPVFSPRFLIAASWPLVGLAGTPGGTTPAASPSGIFGTDILGTESRWMAGGWDGGRDELASKGLSFQFGYTSEFAGNATGGVRRTGAYADQWLAAANFDTEKAGAWEGGMFRIAWTDRNGSELGSRAGLGTNQQPQEVYGRGSYLRLTQFWYEQALFDDGLSVKAGLVSMGEDFFNVPADFQNLTFIASLMGNIAGDYIYNWPVSQWGACAKINPKGEVSFSTGVYEVNPHYVDSAWVKDRGWRPDFPGGSTGVIVPMELAWHPEVLGLPGRYFVGGWVATNAGDDPVDDLNGNSRLLTGLPAKRHDLRDGVYAGMSQYVYGRPDAPVNARVFLRFVQTDPDTSVNDRQFALGMIYGGPFGRPRDSIGCAIGATHFSDRIRRDTARYNAATGSNLPLRDYEYVTELFYAWSPVPWMKVQPNVQYILRPGGTGTNDDALVFGLKTSLTF